MKIKNLLWIFFIAATLVTACSKNGQDVDYDSDNQYLTTYMSVKLVGTQHGTRTSAGDDGVLAGTKEESAIQNALVLLTNGSGVVTSAVSPVIEPTLTGANTRPFKVGEGTHYVYVIANPGDITKEMVQGKNIKDVELLMYASGQIKDYASNGSFLMFNECNGTDDIAGMEIVVTALNTIDNPAQGAGAIKLDRLAAKLTSTAQNVDIQGVEGQLPAISAVELQGFVLLNGAKKAYLQQHWSGLKQAQWPYENTLITPMVTFDDFYATAEDYTNIESGSIEDLTKEDLWNTNPVYCMENNPIVNGSAGLRGSSTGIIYRWQVTNPDSDEKAGENCFYGYNGQYYSSLKALQDAWPSAFNEENKVSDEAGRAQELEDATQLLVADIGAFRVKYQVKVYEKGIMYYTFYIKDQNYVGPDQNPYYSIMRNTIYGLNVTTLLKIGTDIPGEWEPDPEKPIDQKELYMLVKTEVNPWVLSNQDISLQ